MSDQSAVRIACPQCGTRYKLPVSRLTGKQTTLKCNQCEHSFPLRAPKPRVKEPSGFLVRDGADGPVEAAPSLDTVKRWVIEGRLGPDHELGRAGEDGWRKLSEIESLHSFFRVAEQQSGPHETVAGSGPGEVPVGSPPPRGESTDEPPSAPTSDEPAASSSARFRASGEVESAQPPTAQTNLSAESKAPAAASSGLSGGALITGAVVAAAVVVALLFGLGVL